MCGPSFQSQAETHDQAGRREYSVEMFRPSSHGSSRPPEMRIAILVLAPARAPLLEVRTQLRASILYATRPPCIADLRHRLRRDVSKTEKQSGLDHRETRDEGGLRPVRPPG
jgi:hypothetical protein